MATDFVTWDTANQRGKRQSLSIPDQRAGRATVTVSTTSVAVTFSSAIASTSYSVMCSWQNTTDATPQFQPIVITAFSTTGFTATWNAPVDTANYSINWNAVAFV